MRLMFKILCVDFFFHIDPTLLWFIFGYILFFYVALNAKSSTSLSPALDT